MIGVVHLHAPLLQLRQRARELVLVDAPVVARVDLVEDDEQLKVELASLRGTAPARPASPAAVDTGATGLEASLAALPLLIAMAIFEAKGVDESDAAFVRDLTKQRVQEAKRARAAGDSEAAAAAAAGGGAGEGAGGGAPVQQVEPPLGAADDVVDLLDDEEEEAAEAGQAEEEDLDALLGD